MVVNAGDDASAAEFPRSSRRRGRRGMHEAGSGAAPLSMTWPGGCALDWEERERVGRAALERCSQTTAARGIQGWRQGRGTACSPLALSQIHSVVFSPCRASLSAYRNCHA